MRLNLVLVAGLAVALVVPAASLQAALCAQDRPGCCCPDESACPCAHGQDDAPPPAAESTLRPCSDETPAEVLPLVSHAAVSPAGQASLVAQPAPAPDELLLLLATFRC